MIKISRIYANNSPDGYRILVDRLWPRGLKREASGVDLWLKDIAPSTELRKWFSHDASRWTSFVRRYHDELQKKPELLQMIDQLHREHGVLVLLYAAKSERFNNAAALAEFFRKRGT